MQINPDKWFQNAKILNEKIWLLSFAMMNESDIYIFSLVQFKGVQMCLQKMFKTSWESWNFLWHPVMFEK